MKKPFSMDYIANIRLPTDRAHGYQIMKMCEAFALLGVRVVLRYPRRNQPNRLLKNINPFRYYGIAPIFTLDETPNLDIVRLNHVLSDRFFMPFFFLHAFLWSWYVARRAARAGADLYYARDDEVAYWLLRKNLPTVYEAHGIPHPRKYWMLRAIASSPTLVGTIALTVGIKRHLSDIGFKDHLITVAHDAVDPGIFNNLPSRDILRTALRLPHRRRIIAYAGRFETKGMDKGLDIMIEALPFLDADIVVMLIGYADQEEMGRYATKAEERGVLDRLIMIPFADRALMARYIASADALILPFPAGNEHYRSYMSPLKMFEYMAAEVPIISSDLPAIREVLDDTTAFFYEPSNIASYIRCVGELFADSVSAMRRARVARSRVARYSWIDRAERIMNACRSLE
jgi:glycosyltransferase involved in cell wall biosynthesis